ncbi:MAG: phosphatidylglycerophosphatase A [Deltaproteobacteria bacterium]|nr:phosphatidylglycerophosphatase A [Deltaproteobacteria bacterium]
MRGKAALILASWFGVGLVPFAPGTAGTLAGMPLVLFTGCLETPEAALFDLVFIAVSVWTADLSSRILQKDDPSVVVIDEVAGFLLTLFLVPLNLGNVCLGFLLFRLFDVLKPFPIKKLENLRGGLGIVADDLLAGVYANLSLRLLIFFL